MIHYCRRCVRWSGRCGHVRHRSPAEHIGATCTNPWVEEPSMIDYLPLRVFMLLDPGLFTIGRRSIPGHPRKTFSSSRLKASVAVNPQTRVTDADMSRSVSVAAVRQSDRRVDLRRHRADTRRACWGLFGAGEQQTRQTKTR